MCVCVCCAESRLHLGRPTIKDLLKPVKSNHSQPENHS